MPKRLMKRLIAVSAMLLQTISAQSIQKIAPSSVLHLNEIEAIWALSDFQIDSIAAEGNNWCVLATANESKLSSPIWPNSAHCSIDGREGLVRLPVGSRNLVMKLGFLKYEIKNAAGKIERFRVSMIDTQKSIIDRNAIQLSQLATDVEDTFNAGPIIGGSQMNSEPEVVQSRYSFLASNGDIIVVHSTTERIFRFTPSGSLISSVDMQLDGAFDSLGYSRVRKHPINSGLTRFAHAWRGPNDSVLLFLIGVPFMGETPIAAVDLATGQVKELISLVTPRRSDRDLVGGPEDFTFFFSLVQAKQLIAASKEGTIAFYPIQFSSDGKR